MNTETKGNMTIMSADETKYIINQEFLDFYKSKESNTDSTDAPNLLVCKSVYLGINDNVANYIEVDKETVDACQEYLDEFVALKKTEYESKKD